MSERTSDHASFEYHQLALRKAAENWTVALELARENVIRLRNSGTVPENRLNRLEALLKEGPDVCTYVLLSHTQVSRELRQCCVFSGILDEGR